MKKLADFTGNAAFEVLAKIMPEIMEIAKDKDFKQGIKLLSESDVSGFGTIFRVWCGKHPEQIKVILAAMNEVPVADFEPSASEIVMELSELMGDSDFIRLFM